MPQVPLPWGDGVLTLSLPEHWRIEQVAQGSLPTAPSNWPELLALALTQPGTGEPLGRLLAARPRGRIALLVEDETRHSPLPEILPVLMREILHAGVQPEQMEIVLATGMHPPMSDAQVRRKLGAAVEGIRWRCNPWEDPSAYKHVGRSGKMDILLDRGVAEADLRILVSSVSPHVQAGFGGGYKMLLPGCAHLETIRSLHQQGVGRGPRQLVGLEGPSNPMRSTIDAAGLLIEKACGRCFSVQYLLDESNHPALIATGEVLPTQRMMAKRCAVAYGVVIQQPADVVITNAHPLDLDLWQSFKCIANTQWAVRPNGLILCLTRCVQGLNGVRPIPWPLSPLWSRRLIRLFGPEVLVSTIIRLVPRLAGDAAFFLRLASQTLHRAPVYLACPILHAAGQKFPGMEIFPGAEQAIAAADQSLRGAPQRVIVFPHGGTTFPVLPAASVLRPKAEREGPS